MKLRITFALLTLFLLSANTHAQNNHAPDEVTLREVVKQMENGWNTKSGALYAKSFLEDADFVVIDGTHVKGRAAIAAGHQRIFDTIFKDTKLQLDVEKIRFLRPEVAVVHVKGRREGPTRELTKEARLTLVMAKEKQGWAIAAFQNTAIAPPQ